jgi:hypothetical protein
VRWIDVRVLKSSLCYYAECGKRIPQKGRAMVNICSPRTIWVLSALGVTAVAAPAVLCLGAGIARADGVDSASVQSERATVDGSPGLLVTVTDTAGGGGPGTYGSCEYNATPIGGALTQLAGLTGGQVEPLDQLFLLQSGGTQQLRFPGEVPAGTIWAVTVNCTDPASGYAGNVYNEQLSF